MEEYLKFEFYVPDTHLAKVKKAVFAAGAGIVGCYDSCCWETLGVGQFRPLEGSEPFVGNHDSVEKVKEYKVEMLCAEDKIEQVIQALKDSHPYETPAYQYWKVRIS